MNNTGMDEQEMPLIQITTDDITDANRLSLHCPICASAVEKNADAVELAPVYCGNCKTLYHRVCWDNSGGKCAILGCDHTEFLVYGQAIEPALRINYADLPQPSANGRVASPQTKRLKEEQRRQVEQLRQPSPLQRLWRWLLDQIRILNE